MSCTSFNGNFNSQTGNFEIVVQFIGYEYGILGDIPFNLLVAAPMNGTGKAYWDAHVNSEEWKLSKDGDAPITLYQFFQYIKSEISPADKTPNSDKNSETVILGINQQLKSLTLIKQYITEFKSLLKEKYNGNRGYVIDCANDNENVVFLFSTSDKFIIDNELCEKRNQIQESITDYNNSYSSSEYGGGVLNTLIPNYDNNAKWEPQEIKVQEFIQYNKANDKTKINDLLPNSQNVSNWQIINSDNVLSFVNINILKLVSGSTYKITNGVSQELTKNLITTNWFLDNKGYAPYAAVIDFGTGIKDIDDKITTLNENYRDSVYNYELRAQKNIVDKVGMVPYVGRYYKMVMCHLETFIQTIKMCVDGIYDQMNEKDGKKTRIPSNLGIKDIVMETDVPMERGGKADQQPVPPFPAVYRRFQTAGEAKEVLNLTNNAEIKANAWIGDFDGDWLEKSLVDEIYEAAQNINNSVNNSDTGVPVASGNRVGDNKCLNPFNFIYKIPNYVYKSLDGMLLYIALKAETTLNMMQSNDISDASAKNLGMYDAYWLIKKCKDEVLLKELKNTNLYNSIVFTDEFKKSVNKHQFEFVVDDKHNGRHPVFDEDGNNVKYTYMTNNSEGVEFIPCGFCESIEGRVPFSIEYNYSAPDNFTPKNADSSAFVVYGTSPEKIERYKNTRQFVVTSSIVDLTAFRNTYNDFKNSSNKIGDTPTKTINTTLSQYIYVDESRNDNFYNIKLENYTSYKNQRFEKLNDGDLDNINREEIINNLY